MSKSISKIIVELLVAEIIFLIIYRLALIIIPHSPYELIYHININFNYVTAFLIWKGFRLSQVNRNIVLFFGLLTTFTLSMSILMLFSDINFPEYFNVVNYHILHSIGTTFQLFFSFFIFFFSVNPHQHSKHLLNLSLFFGLLIGSIVYIPFLLTTDFSSWVPLFQRAYYLNIINLSLLSIFWHQYTSNKVIFSEYLSSILSVYTIFIGIEIFHFFSYQNDLVFHYISQYFYAFLNMIALILWLLRYYYLKAPESSKNEEYIKNYNVLHGIVSKPRQGILVEFYTNLNKTIVISIIVVIIFLGVFLFFFNKFQIFIRLNLLLLILAVIISLILAIVTWHRRWYDAIGFLFKGTRSKKNR